MYFSTDKEMEKLDELAVQYGLEIRQMMELAGWHMLEIFNDFNITKDKSILVVCGRGNKAGDGLAAAKHLINYGYKVSVILLSKDLKSDPQHHLEFLEKMSTDILFYNNIDIKKKIKSADIIIDALIGYHLNGRPRDNYAKVINLINNSKAIVIAYDIPSGIKADTGECLQPCIKAHITLSLAMPKKLFSLMTSLEKSGQVYVADIGIPNFLYNRIKINSRPNFSKGGLIKL